MWDSPSWMGSAISAKVKRDSDAATRTLNEFIASEDRKAREHIQDMINATNKEIAQMNITSNESINAANRANNLAVAAINASSRSLPQLIPFVFGKALSDNNKSNTNNKGNSSGGAQAIPVTSGVVTEAQKKADSAFPTLEPTFKQKAMDMVRNLSQGANLTSTSQLGLGGVVSTMTSLPVLLFM